MATIIDKKLLTPVQKFIRTESSGGILLLVFTVLAIIMANSPLSEFYQSLWKYEFGIKTPHFQLVKPLFLWINDGLMAVFFFVIGLEIKREVLIGELNSPKKIALPVFAAIGGMVMPMMFYLILNDNPATAKGWGIPMATDIAFALLVLSMLGKRIPLGLKVFLVAFAIIDDVGAVLVIALFYTSHIEWHLLIYALILLSALYVLSILRIYRRYLILFFGLVIWVLFLKSGVHPTIAGILLAFAVPIRQRIDEYKYADKLRRIVDNIVANENTNKLPVLTQKQIEEIDNLEDWTSRVQSPLQQLEHRLHKWVAFLIIPLFAFANAGFSFSQSTGMDFNLAGNIAISLLAGKFSGILLFSLIMVKLRLAELPGNTSFLQIAGVSLLAGIGFTMSLFIENLAFPDNAMYLNSGKAGIIAGSLIAGLLGLLVLRFSGKPKNNAGE